MLDYVIEQTEKFIQSTPKEKRKSCGQFFTSKATARFMAELFNVPSKKAIRILDPGAGSGILSAAIIEAVDNGFANVKEIELVCYETNPDIIPLLEANVEFIKQSTNKKLRKR